MRTLDATRALAASLCCALLGAPVLAQDTPAVPARAALERARAVERDLVDLVARVSPAFVMIGGGSGIVVSPEGDVLTNHHVAGSRAPGEVWDVLRPGGQRMKARMIGTDSRGDISLLRLEGEGPFPYVEMTDSDQVQVGDAVVALGNPFGFSKDGSPHVTLGVVSAVHRFQGGYSDAIMTDTAINPGNSGGPLLDIQGRLIGINGKIAMRWGTRANSGVGYAIPANQIKAFIPEFRVKGVVRHGAVHGVRLDNSPAGGDGALVRGVNAGSEAAKAGLKVGDVIVEADGRAVTTSQRFEGIVGTLPEGASLPVVVLRGGERVDVTLTLEPRAGEGQQVRRGAYLGIRMSTRQEGDGVEVEEVTPDSPAAAADLQAGDVIKGVGPVGGPRTAVRTINDLVGILSNMRPKQKLVLALERGSEPLEKEVTLGDWPK